MKDHDYGYYYTIAICEDAYEGGSGDYAGVVQTRIENDGSVGSSIVIGRYNETELMMGSECKLFHDINSLRVSDADVAI